jgi:hypothetical protein
VLQPTVSDLYRQLAFEVFKAVIIHCTLNKEATGVSETFITTYKTNGVTSQKTAGPIPINTQTEMKMCDNYKWQQTRLRTL